MTRSLRAITVGIALIVALLVAFTACGTAGPTSTATEPATLPVDTVVATTTTYARLQAGPVKDWAGWSMTEVCVIDEQTYPQVPGYRYDIEGLLRRLLQPAGIVVLPAGQPCAASLTVVMSLEGRPAEY